MVYTVLSFQTNILIIKLNMFVPFLLYQIGQVGSGQSV